ncbi:hypothetical protein BKA69DRAFT_1035598 [Paraphysoderma sedebokerense]|nr:hypothetical protein BKA69DRAFT_1035598 [Paraphysoderma sedebokerense]
MNTAPSTSTSPRKVQFAESVQTFHTHSPLDYDRYPIITDTLTPDDMLEYQLMQIQMKQSIEYDVSVQNNTPSHGFTGKAEVNGQCSVPRETDNNSHTTNAAYYSSSSNIESSSNQIRTFKEYIKTSQPAPGSNYSCTARPPNFENRVYSVYI